MELSWSTFVLEMLNFLVLVWILKRFLYKPVLQVIARRQAAIEKTRADAEALHKEAGQLEEKYQGRLADWNRERQQSQNALTEELRDERELKLHELQTELEQERQKARIIEASRQADTQRKIEETALVQAAQFAAKLLQGAAGADTEARLVEMAISGLLQLPSGRIAAIRNSLAPAAGAIVVTSAFPLGADQKHQLEQALQQLSGQNIPVRFEQDSDLLAGVRITLGAWILGANIRDELKGMADLAVTD